MWQGTEAPCQQPVKELKTHANGHVSEPSWNWIFQPQSGLQMPVTLVNIITVISLKTQARTIQISCSVIFNLWKLCNYKCLFFKPLNFEILCYTEIDS